MYYLIQVPTDQQDHLLTVFSNHLPDLPEPIPYAVGGAEGDHAVPMAYVADYYRLELQTRQPDLLPWDELPEATRLQFGQRMCEQVNFLFPMFKFDQGTLEPKFVAELMGRTEHHNVPILLLPLA